MAGLTKVEDTGVVTPNKVVQIVSVTYSVEAANSTNTPADTGLTATITPTNAANKIIVMVSQNGCTKQNATYMGLNLYRDATNIALISGANGYTNSSLSQRWGGDGGSYEDSPNTTSPVVYKTKFYSGSDINQVTVQDGTTFSTITLIEVTP